MNISVFGLGKLGAPLAVLLASKGHDVIGYDVDPRPGRLLESGASPVPEPGMSERLTSLAGSFAASADPEEAVRRSTITFVVVPTPSDADGAFSSRSVVEAGTAIGRALRGRSQYHLVILTSTVMPGETRDAFVPAIEAGATAACGSRFGVCYNPEFIALGTVIRDMLQPDLVLIGESDQRAGMELERFYRGFCDNRPPIARTTFENAEVAKLALNTFVTMKIAFANVLADICDHLPTGNVDAVTDAVGLDTRVGRKYLSGGAGYGGPCFPRDVIAFTALARRLGLDSPLAEATQSANNARIHTIVSRVLENAAVSATIGVLGLSYKPGTPVIDCSQGIELARRLAGAGRRVVVYDPMALDAARRELGGTVTYCTSVEDAVRQSDTSVIMTPWPEFRELPLAILAAASPRKSIIDCWRILDSSRLAPFADVVGLGQGPRVSIVAEQQG